MSKKILSLALAVVMLFSICAFSASAALADGQVGIRLETNATVGMAAGESVWVKVYFEVPTTDGYTHANSNVCLAFTDAFEVATASPNTTNSYDAREWGASYAEYFKDTSAVNTKTALFTTVSGNFTANDTAKGWDGVVLVQQATNTDNGYTPTSGYPIDPDCEVFTINFTTTRALTADDSIGVPECSVTKGQTVMKYISSGASKTYAKSLDTIVVSDAVVYATAAAKNDVYKLSDPRKHADGDKYTVAAFFAFDGAKIAPDFVNGTSQFIKGITATVTATSGGQSITVTPDAIRFVYDLKDGTYGFRVIMKNVPADAEITIVPAVTTDGTEYTVDTLNFNVADVTAY